MLPQPAAPPVGGSIFTLGYQLRSLDEFIAELQAAAVDVLVDVRETPWSQRRDYTKAKLTSALAEEGIEYVHARFAGNPKAIRNAAGSHQDCLEMYTDHLRGSPHVITALDDLIQERLANGQRLCFTCYERHPEDCHRSILLEQWAAVKGLDLAVQHLGPDGAPRLAVQDRKS